MSDKLKKGIDCDQPPLWFRNQVTKELLDNETPEVKAEVKQHRLESAMDPNTIKVDSDDEETSSKTEAQRRAQANARYQT